MSVISTNTQASEKTGDKAVASIVVIEDEADIRQVIEINLAAEGYSVQCAADGQSGLELVRREKPDLVLLDLMLPGLNGLDICRELKGDAATRQMPLIMVTAKGEESDIVLGLGLGAEDYITKPFRVNELLARVKAAFRRREELKPGLANAEVIRHSGITLDAAQHKLTVDGSDVDITATEFRLLKSLLGNAGRVYSRELLIDIAIGDDVFVNERTIDSHISSVRRKLGPYRTWLKTVWGVGYRFDPQPQGS
jgi:two-component system phosphate regulon response regulator PhoB